ncbi:MAG: TetR/AcrR family transcriptional regulator [Burkholderiales bacterium]|nr:TetR/AcrR family transcriptional regulator [Burkholderiales bacterium]
MANKALRTLPKALDPPVPENGRKRLGRQTRERVMEVAAGMLLQGSVSAMSIAELVRLSGAPASSIYWHFGSKEGLVTAVAATAIERWLGSLPDVASFPASGEERVVAGIAGITAALARDARMVTLVIKVGVELGPGRHAGVEVVRRARADVLQYGVRLFAPAFAGLSRAKARAAALRMSSLLMATADGIAVNAATLGQGGAAANDYRVLADLAVLLYRQQAT